MAVGKTIPVFDAIARVNGTIPYAANLKLPGMLVAKVLRSPLPHARIVGLNAAAAESLPGVAAVLTAADFESPDSPALYYGMSLKDQPIVAHEQVRYTGQPVALVAAESAERAEAALAQIEVDYEELPGVYDAVEARQPGAPVLHEAYPDNCFVHAKLRRGDLAAGLAEADDIIEETFTSPLAQHAALEPHVAAAQWQADRLIVWSATQSPYLVRQTLADIFDLPAGHVRVIVPPLGGGYGGKGHIRIEPMVAALARKTAGRPVKLILSRAEEFVTVTKHAATITIKTGFKRDGALTARQVTLYWNAGAYADVSPVLVPAGMVRSIGPYRIPAVWVDSYGVYTNLPPAGAFRGAMSSQAAWAYESHMDTIARRLGLDPLELRLKNLLRSGDLFATGETLHDLHFAECLEAVAEGIGWREARPADSGPVKRGRGLAVMMKSTSPTSRSECRLKIAENAQMTLFTSTVEMGQGAHTALAQIAAEAAGVAVEQVKVTGPDTAVTPFDSTTSASRSSGMMGSAILKAGAVLKEKLIEAGAPLLEYAPEELRAEAGYVFVAAQPDQRLSYAEILQRNGLSALEAAGEFATKGGLDPETGQGLSTPHWHQGAGACEVAVDTDTGKVTVLRYHAASFAGRVVNPQLAHLQNEGNVIFGLGPALLEEMVTDNGQIINTNLSDYQIPSFLDTPLELVSTLVESAAGEFHGIGEMTLPPVAPAIANAVFDAVGVRIRDLPMTPEKVLRALRQAEGE
ncbi:MAG: xanthine dehydrogenase family protein molybdopterin-binding subunit [Anaerolineae bacterium]|nr:xanthine dehydrogenase family protein molybdopterin-binding subunit [Anaerolineae bacterium]